MRALGSWFLGAQARSSAVEHYLDTVGVGGSIPPVPTGLQRSGVAREPGAADIGFADSTTTRSYGRHGKKRR